MDKYKKFCIGFVILSVFCFLVIHPLLFYANLGIEDAPARVADNWYKIKEGHANSASGKRLFVLGCSTVTYGVDTELMEKELGITAVNFGSTANMNVYMFDRIKRSLASGDIVLLPLEYDMYRDFPHHDGVIVYVLEFDPDYFWKMPFCDKVQYVYGLGSSFLIKRIVARRIYKKYGDEENIFLSSKHLNANGDLTNNTYETRTYKKPKTPSEQHFSEDCVLGNRKKQILNDFVDFCRNNHITLYVTWPPIYLKTEKTDFDGHDAEYVESIKSLWSSNNVTILGDYRDAFFEADDCYNIATHLNERGKAKYTKHLINLIRPYI